MMDEAMVLAAGLGTRIRTVADDRPKPMIEVAGKPLIDWTLDMLAKSGIRHAVVNVHHMAAMIEGHVRHRTAPTITISDERDERLETGGGLMKATPHFQSGPVFCTNTDAILMPSDQGTGPDLLRDAWRDEAMDALLLLVPLVRTSGYDGHGDFAIDETGRLSQSDDAQRHVFSGLQIIHPRLWKDEPITAQSTRVFWDRAKAAGRLYGLVYDGWWMHVGDRAGFDAAERRLAEPYDDS